MTSDLEKIKALFNSLHQREPIDFPHPYKTLKATTKKGVYLILSPTGIVLHVGNTPRAMNGINQRLKDHLSGSSSFAKQYLRPLGKNLRIRYKFKYIKVSGSRQRALLQAYAIGCLCPKHIGVG